MNSTRICVKYHETMVSPFLNIINPEFQSVEKLTAIHFIIFPNFTCQFPEDKKNKYIQPWPPIYWMDIAFIET